MSKTAAAGKLIYLKGDATEPVSDGDYRIIVHCVNDVGVWGAGFVLALSKKWLTPEMMYRSSSKSSKLELGTIQLVPVMSGVGVCNLVGQVGVGGWGGRPPIRYDAINWGLEALRDAVEDFHSKNISFHMPRMGAGLAGGDWRIIEALVNVNLVDFGYNVYVYDL